MSATSPTPHSRKRCLVLGGSGYIGQAVCRTLNAHGAQVAYTWHRHAVDLPGCRGIQLDLRDELAQQQCIASLLHEWQGLDVLMQCAGVAIDHEYRDRRQRHDMQTVLIDATLDACHQVLPHLASGGAIIVVGAIDGLRSLPSPLDYAAAKGGQLALVRALAKQAGPRNVTVNLLAPGLLNGGVAQYALDSHRQDYLQHCSLKRLGEAAEVANWAKWLALENTYLTAQAIVLDGGL